jgi:hypothetical protein
MRGALLMPILTLALAAALAGQGPSVNPNENLRSAHGPWVAQRQAPSHVVVCFGFLDPRRALPPGVSITRNPSAGDGCDFGRVTADSMRKLQAMDPYGEHFQLGDRYRLLVDAGAPLIVTVSDLYAVAGDYTSPDAQPGVDTYVGAALAIAPADAKRFQGLKSSYFMLERMDAPYAPPDTSAKAGDWEPPPPGIAAALTGLAAKASSLPRAPHMQSPPRSLSVQCVLVGENGQPEACILKVTWPGMPPAPQSPPYVYSWVAFAPAPHFAGVPDAWDVHEFDIQNVIPLDGGRVAVLAEDEAEYKFSAQLWMLEADGTFHLVHAYGAVSD